MKDLFEKIKSKAATKLNSGLGALIIFLIVVAILLIGISLLISFSPIFTNNPKLILLLSILFFIFSPGLSLGFSFSLYQIYNTSSINPFAFIIIAIRYFYFAWKLSFRIFIETIYESVMLISSFLVLALSIFASSIFLMILAYICIFISIVLLIMKLYYFSFANYFFFDNPDISAKSAVLKSKKIMLGGNRLKLFLLKLSFIPYYLILELIIYLIVRYIVPYFGVSGFVIINSIITIIKYIFEFWINYYSQFADIAFYKYFRDLQNKQKEQENLNLTHQYDMLEKAELKHNETIENFDTFVKAEDLETFDIAENTDTFDTTDSLDTYDSVKNYETFDTFDTIQNTKEENNDK